MHTIPQLWLPILVSAVVVFIVSSVIHMLTPWHKNDFPPLPNEEGVMDALRPFNIPPGDYHFPRPKSRADLGSAEYAERRSKGPVVLMTVMPSGPMSMSGNLAGWFLYALVISVFAAHFAPHPGAGPVSSHYLFHQVALAAFGGYTLALWQMTIWYRRAWNLTLKATVDGLIYGVLTGLVFVWLWPS